MYGCRYLAKFSSWLFFFSNILLTSKFVFIFKTDVNLIQFVSFYSVVQYIFNNFTFIQ